MQNNTITSMHNAIVKDIVQLQKKKTVRKKEKLFVVEGIRSVKEIPSNYHVKYYITTPYLTKEQIPHLKKVKHYIVSEDIYKTISDTVAPQGIMAVVEIPNVKLAEIDIKKAGFYLVLENIQDPGNLGTIIRTAHAFKVQAILISKGSVDLYSPKVVRATMGSLFHIPICINYEIEEYLYYLQEGGVSIFATSIEKAQPIFHNQFNRQTAIVIGNEGNGISKYVKENVKNKIMIPMPGGSESLNASIAASICMYEVMRQMTLPIDSRL